MEWAAPTSPRRRGLTGAGATWSLGDPDGDGKNDVVLLMTKGTATGSTEVHTLGGSTGFSSC